jgi:antitoxin VapB
MALSIRNPRVEELARQLAAKRNMTMTDVIVHALEKEAKDEIDSRPLREKHKEIADRLLRLGQPDGHRMTKDEIDRMWGHE